MRHEPADPRIAARASSLELRPDGIWFARGDLDEAFAQHDDTHWAEIEARSFWYRHRNQVLLDLLQRFPYRGWLFEIGAGNGAVCGALQLAGHPVVAVEPTVSWARRARARGIRHVICAHFEKAGFSAGALDNVGMFDVLEHVDDDRAFLSELRRLMPSKGRLYLAVPAFMALWSHEDELSGHRRRYRSAEMQTLLQTTGFSLEYTSYFFAPLVAAISIARAMPYRLGIAARRTHERSAAAHGLHDSMPAKLVRGVLQAERALLRTGITLPVGSSLLAVARAV